MIKKKIRQFKAWNARQRRHKEIRKVFRELPATLDKTHGLKDARRFECVLENPHNNRTYTLTCYRMPHWKHWRVDMVKLFQQDPDLADAFRRWWYAPVLKLAESLNFSPPKMVAEVHHYSRKKGKARRIRRA